MPFPPRLTLATRNPGKIRELLRICAGWPVEWLTAADIGLPELEETGDTYLENALLKARGAAEATGIPSLADDSGIEVDVLDGGPGPRSARFAGEKATDEENLALLIEQVRAVPPEERSARYRCMAVCAWPEGRHLGSEAICEGTLILEPRGSGGFGYDPVFVPVGETRTMAELDPAEKDRISHRGKAFRALGALLSSAG